MVAFLVPAEKAPNNRGDADEFEVQANCILLPLGIAMATEAEIYADLLRLETLLLNPASCSRPETLWPLFANEFVEIGSSGRIYDREQTVASLATVDSTRGELSEFRVVLLTEDIAHVTYRAMRYGEPPQYSLRSSIWRRRGVRWQIAFHQGTLTTP